MLEKFIYKTFTIQNNIKLTKESIKLIKLEFQIENNLNQRDILNKIKDLCYKYKSLTSELTININILSSILNLKCSIKPFNYKFKYLIEHFKFLKKKFNNTIDISDIKKDTECILLGYVYKNKMDELIIEDCTGFININSEYCDMFVLVKGRLIGNVFITCSNNIFNKQDKDLSINKLSLFAQHITDTEDYLDKGDLIKLNDKRILISTEEIQHNEKDILLVLNNNCKVRDNKIYITDLFPYVFTYNGFNISLYNKEVISNINDVIPYLNTYDHNWKDTTNLFYETEYDIQVVRSKHQNIIRYNRRVFVLLCDGSTLEVSQEGIKFIN